MNRTCAFRPQIPPERLREYDNVWKRGAAIIRSVQLGIVSNPSAYFVRWG